MSVKGRLTDLKYLSSDFAIIPAALFTIGWFAFVIAQGVYGGVGKHVWDQTYQEVYWNFRVGHPQSLYDTITSVSNDSISLKLGTIGTLWFWVAVCAIKVSIVLFNRRLTGLTSRPWMIAHYSFLAVITGFLIAAIFTSIFRCTGPVEATFSVITLGKNPPTERKCLDQNKLGYGLAIVHSALDFALLTVPIIVLYQMKRISIGKKIRLGFLFAVGAISCIGSVMRQIIQEHTINSKDQNWDYPHIVSWTIVDIFFGIVAANLPVLNALVPKRWRSASSNDDVPHMSTFKSGGRDSVRLGSPPAPCRPDGTRVEGSVDIPKDAFHEKTVRRWEDAFTRHKSLHNTDIEGNGRVLDDSSS